MVELYGQLLTREQLLARVGDVSQVGGVRLGELADGAERGLRVADFRTGAGLAFTVHVDRGLAIGALEFAGEALAWTPPSCTPPGTVWMAPGPGGALSARGLGQSCDGASPQGTYRAAAQDVVAGGAWQGNEYEMFVAGRVCYSSAFGDRLQLERRIAARLGESRLTIRDRVSNIGGSDAPLTIAYHCSLGYPVLDDESELLAPSRAVWPADEVSRAGLEGATRFDDPQPGSAPQVFYHDLLADGDGLVRVALVNHRQGIGRGLGVYLRYRKHELPYFTEHKLLRQVDYLVDLAPANCRPADGAAPATELLAPGEAREYALEIGALPDNGAIEKVERDMQREHGEWVRRWET
ncbi:MAG TPA: DUF4432 family protein [Anaerolineae bacterium]|nr:DUF4432 family protein [Anaerolineae bacterium]